MNSLFLNTGDTIGIISPSGRIESDFIDNAIKHFESWGLNVVTGKHVLLQENQFAGNDRQRAEDFQEMLNNPIIKAVICSRGGYGAIRTAQLMDFSGLEKNPKWIIGYSDITVFHQYVNNTLKIPSIHGTMPKNFPPYPNSDHSLNTLRSLLFGKLPEYAIPDSAYNIQGQAEGILTGGNLSILYSLRGTEFDYDFKDKILFIEDLSEYLYHLDRIMMNLKIGKKLNQIKGIIIGGFSDMKDNNIPFGKNAYEIISDYVDALGVPVCFNFPAGHIKENLPLIMGTQVRLEVKRNKSNLSYKLA